MDFWKQFAAIKKHLRPRNSCLAMAYSPGSILSRCLDRIERTRMVSLLGKLLEGHSALSDLIYEAAVLVTSSLRHNTEHPKLKVEKGSLWLQSVEISVHNSRGPTLLFQPHCPRFVPALAGTQCCLPSPPLKSAWKPACPHSSYTVHTYNTRDAWVTASLL